MTELQPGDRVVLIEDVEHFPTILCKAGEAGTVTAVDDEIVYVAMDRHHAELNNWDNVLQVELADHPNALERIPRV